MSFPPKALLSFSSSNLKQLFFSLLLASLLWSCRIRKISLWKFVCVRIFFYKQQICNISLTLKNTPPGPPRSNSSRHNWKVNKQYLCFLLTIFCTKELHQPRTRAGTMFSEWLPWQNCFRKLEGIKYGLQSLQICVCTYIRIAVQCWGHFNL
jgi:hypothetical protein